MTEPQQGFINTLRKEAASLLSVTGENPEYDRALCELVAVMSSRPGSEAPQVLEELQQISTFQ